MTNKPKPLLVDRGEIPTPFFLNCNCLAGLVQLAGTGFLCFHCPHHEASFWWKPLHEKWSISAPVSIEEFNAQQATWIAHYISDHLELAESTDPDERAVGEAEVRRLEEYFRHGLRDLAAARQVVDDFIRKPRE